MSVYTYITRVHRFELSAAQFLRLALASVAALWLIVVTGAAVRLTDSGLGCRHWPGCEKGHPLPAKDYHAYIEFGNRVIGGVTIVVVLLTALGAWRTPRLSRASRRLALAVFLGTLAQAPLGYLAVKTDLRWPVVAAHLLLSMAVLAGAVVLVLETYAALVGHAEPVVPLELRRFALVVAGAALALLVTGTLATAGGRGRLRARPRLPARLPRGEARARPAPVRVRRGGAGPARSPDDPRRDPVPDAPPLAARAGPRGACRRGLGTSGRLRDDFVAPAARRLKPWPASFEYTGDRSSRVRF